MYTLEDLERIFRKEVEDKELPYFWDQCEFLRLYSQAAGEFARKTKILADELDFEVKADEPYIELEQWVVDFRRAWLDSRPNRPLNIRNWQEMDEGHLLIDEYGYELTGDWLNRTGEPRILILDMVKDKIRLSPIPTQDDIIHSLIWREPKRYLTDTGMQQEITKRHHQEALVWGACALALGQQDADTFDPDRANKYQGMFDDAISEVEGEQRRLRRRAGTVRYGGL